MGIRFVLRGTSKTPHFSYDGANWGEYANIVDPVNVEVNNSPGVFGGSVLNLVPISVTKGLTYHGGLNVGAVDNTGGFSILMRIVPSVTASPFTGIGLEIAMKMGLHGHGYRLGINSSGKAVIQVADLAGNITATYTGATTINATVNVPFDVMFTWNGTTAANALKVSLNGVEIDTFTVSTPCTNRKVRVTNNITIGYTSAIATSRAKLNELIIWDTQEPHVYTARTDFWPIDAFDGHKSTNPGTGAVLNGQTYYIDGVQYTGTGSLGVSASEIADAIWDEPVSEHTTAGSFGEWFNNRLVTVAKYLKLKG